MKKYLFALLLCSATLVAAEEAKIEISAPSKKEVVLLDEELSSLLGSDIWESFMQLFPMAYLSTQENIKQGKEPFEGVLERMVSEIREGGCIEINSQMAPIFQCIAMESIEKELDPVYRLFEQKMLETYGEGAYDRYNQIATDIGKVLIDEKIIVDKGPFDELSYRLREKNNEWVARTVVRIIDDEDLGLKISSQTRSLLTQRIDAAFGEGSNERILGMLAQLFKVFLPGSDDN